MTRPTPWPALTVTALLAAAPLLANDAPTPRDDPRGALVALLRSAADADQSRVLIALARTDEVLRFDASDLASVRSQVGSLPPILQGATSLELTPGSVRMSRAGGYVAGTWKGERARLRVDTHILASVRGGRIYGVLGVEALSEAEAVHFLPQRGVAGGEQTLSLIRGFESFRSKAYWDVNAWRVGYGSDTYTTRRGRWYRVKKTTRVTREQAELDLRRRVKDFQRIVRRQVGARVFDGLADNVQAGITSVAYNYGRLPSNVVRAVERGGTERIARSVEALKNHNGGVNKRRRLKEAALIRRG